MKLVDWQFASLQKRHHVIDPYEDVLIRELPHGTALAYGQARDGYVLRLSPTSALTNFKAVVDPKYLPKPSETNGLNFIPPQSMMHVLSAESVVVPRGYTGRLELIPEYALCGLTLVETGLTGGVQEGRVLLTIVNPMAGRVMLYQGEGIAKLTMYDEAPLASRAEERGDPQRGGAALALPGGGHAGA